MRLPRFGHRTSRFVDLDSRNTPGVLSSIVNKMEHVGRTVYC